MPLDPCPKCTSRYRQPTGCSCWVRDLYETNVRITAEMETDEFKAAIAACVPYRRPIGFGGEESSRSYYWRWKALGEML